MTYDRQTQLRKSDHSATICIPPGTIEETGWDILLALHSDRHGNLDLDKLASAISVPRPAMECWLPALEGHGLIMAAEHRATGELLAILTRRGRDLIDRYLSASDDLQAGAHR